MPIFVALLRGINVGGHNKVPMADLRGVCSDELGWTEVRSYIQSGNLVFHADAEAPRLESDLEQALASHFDVSTPVIIRPAEKWSSYIDANPFPDASRDAPNRVLLALSKASPKANAAEALQERAADGERIRQAGDALYVHYAGGMARSKISPALLDRLVGSPITGRNWRTVLKLQAMVNEPA